MNTLKQPLFGLLLLTFGALLLGGCSTRTPKDSSIPWSRPADWEGQVPGMAGTGTGR